MADESRHLDDLPFPILIGDIGGTNARFALIADRDAPVERMPNAHTAAYPTIDDAIQATVFDRHGPNPKSAVLALAGPVAGDAVDLTNSDWIVEPRKSVARFGFEEMVLINDFEAQSLALPDLEAEDVEAIGDGTAITESTRVVIGPGTGLGAGALVYTADRWIPVPGEGGHVDLGPQSARDMEIWPHIERPLGRMEAETVLCGAGLVRLYRAVCVANGAEMRHTKPEAVTQAGLAGDDAESVEALGLFATYLGRLAGDLAMIFMARGGVFLTGTISASIAPVLKASAFREAFVAKKPHDDLLVDFATSIIVKPDAALAGIAAFARKPWRFGMELRGRRWGPAQEWS